MPIPTPQELLQSQAFLAASEPEQISLMSQVDPSFAQFDPDPAINLDKQRNALARVLGKTLPTPMPTVGGLPQTQYDKNKSAATKPDISLKRDAADSYEGTFSGKTAQEFNAGVEQASAGFGRMPTHPITGGAQAGLGILQALTSPVAGLGALGGETTGEAVRAGTFPYLGEMGSSILGTAAGAGTNAIIQMAAAPMALSKGLRGLQITTEAVLPKLNAATAAMLEKYTTNFSSLISSKIATAVEKEAVKKAAFDALEPTNHIPLKNTAKALDQLLAAQDTKRNINPSPLKEILENLKTNIEAGGGGLSPIDLNSAMREIGIKVKSLKSTGTPPEAIDPLAARIFAALSKDASTPTQRVTNATPRIQGPTLALPAPGEGSAAIAGGKFEAGPMSKTIQLPPQNKQLALPSPATEPAVEWGGKFEAGKVPMTKQVQSPATERGKFIYDEAGNARPDVYTAPGTGEVPYSGVTVMREGVRPVNEPTVLGRRQSVLDQVGQQPYRNARGGLQPKELKEPWQPGMPVRKLEVTDESARPITPTTSTGRRQRVLSESEQGAYRDPATGEIVAPGTRVQQTDISGQVVLDKRAATRERKSLEDINRTFDKLLLAKRGMDPEFRDFNAARMINFLEDRPKLVEGIPAPDMADLNYILAKIADLSNLPPPRGVMYGAGKAATTVATATGVALAVGGSPVTAAKLSGLITGFQSASKALLNNPTGRKAIIAVLDSGPINQTKVNMLAALANVLKPNYLTEQYTNDQIVEALKKRDTPQNHMQSIRQAIMDNR